MFKKASIQTKRFFHYFDKEKIINDNAELQRGRTLFVKFNPTPTALGKLKLLFKKFNPISFVPTSNPLPGQITRANSKECLCFIEVENESCARLAVKELHGVNFNNSNLTVDFSKTARVRKSILIIKNLPRKYTTGRLHSLFKPLEPIKSFIPSRNLKKKTNFGFGYVELKKSAIATAIRSFNGLVIVESDIKYKIEVKEFDRSL
ncbi:hypothetical protein HK099_003747 [Clydaea vesicula]|uniref:RRM domain-containing protein n=1 Tax=Clydaea vesicula TaxID=447962 RepID=A0AAD5Y1F3_9FUNG|nr:hypothetical protein HK099_003747 [Clydaea vesicula]KAJ3396170.1 hypothetical protein HDU92_003842 [Lobulomyces angularis]